MSDLTPFIGLGAVGGAAISMLAVWLGKNPRVPVPVPLAITLIVCGFLFFVAVTAKTAHDATMAEFGISGR